MSTVLHLNAYSSRDTGYACIARFELPSGEAVTANAVTDEGIQPLSYKASKVYRAEKTDRTYVLSVFRDD